MISPVIILFANAVIVSATGHLRQSASALRSFNAVDANANTNLFDAVGANVNANWNLNNFFWWSFRYSLQMQTALQQGATSIGSCANDMDTVVNDLETVEGALEDGTSVMDKIRDIFGSINKILKHAEKAKIDKLVGKIPTYGIFIKMGMNIMRRVSGVVSKISSRVSKVLEKITDVVTKTKDTMRTMEVRLTQVSSGLSFGYDAARVGVNCGKQSFKSYDAQKYEKANKDLLDGGAREGLKKIKEAGVACVKAFEPYKKMMKALANAARQIKEALQIINNFADEIKNLADEIDKFIQLILKSEEVQCAMELVNNFGGNLASLVTCPVDEAIGRTMKVIVDTVEAVLTELINTIGNEAIDQAVELLAPKGLRIDLPRAVDFVASWQYNWWYRHKTFTKCMLGVRVSSTIMQAKWKLGWSTPIKEFTSASITASISIPKLQAPSAPTAYESDCAKAWAELMEGEDMENCAKLATEMVDEAERASKQLIALERREREAALMEAKRVKKELERKANAAKQEVANAWEREKNAAKREAKKWTPW